MNTYIYHSSEKRGLRSIFLSGKMLQILLYLQKKKIHLVFFVFYFEQFRVIPYECQSLCDINRGIHKVKLKNALNEKQNIREKFSSKGALWFVIPLIQIHVDTFGPFQCFTRVYSGQFVAFLKSCQTQDKFPNFLRDLQDSKNFEFFLLFFSFQPEKVVNFTTKVELITC